MHSRFEYWGASLEVSWPLGASDLEEFIKCYFAPYFDIGDGRTPSGKGLPVRVEIGGFPPDAPDFEAIPSITIDASKGFLTCSGKVTEMNGKRWVLMEPFGVLAVVDREGGTIGLWGERSEDLRVPLLRVIEDFILNEVQNAGAIVMHASATVASEKAALVIGNKKAGKSSSLCRLLHGFESRKLANDNLCLRLVGGELVARGWPSFFKVSVATVAANPELYGDFPIHARPYLASEEKLWSVYEKVALFPEQAAMRFGTSICPEAPVCVAIFPEFNSIKAPGVRPISIADIADEFPGFLQGVRNPNHADWMRINPVDEGRMMASLRRIMDYLAMGSIPLYKLDWGPSLDELLCSVPELRPSNKGILGCANPPEVDDIFPPLPGPRIVPLQRHPNRVG